MSGIGFSEIILIAGLIVLFFGAKELPGIMRTFGRLTTQVRRYSDQVRNELNSALTTNDPPISSVVDQANGQKKVLRSHYRQSRAAQTAIERQQRSAQIADHLKKSSEYGAAKAVLIYCSYGTEVATDEIIRMIEIDKKRLIVPYCRPQVKSLGIASIADIHTELQPGLQGIPEPVELVRDNFFKSDVQLILCPGLAFDQSGRRLGQGGGYYDNFLGELKGHVAIWGLGFDCQIHPGQLPFDYHDIVMDQVVTENGLLINR